MDSIKRILGLIWMLAGAGLAVFLPFKAITALSTAKASSEDYVFWIVIVAIFIPIVVGFILFGYYSLKGEYNSLESGTR